jgi:hypothetical protein
MATPNATGDARRLWIGAMTRRTAFVCSARLEIVTRRAPSLTNASGGVAPEQRNSPIRKARGCRAIDQRANHDDSPARYTVRVSMKISASAARA